MSPGPAEPTNARLAAALGDRYRIEAEIGRGAMATVHRAHDTRHDRAVAIKVLHPEASTAVGGQRFLREIRVTAGLEHPHVLPLHDSGASGDMLYYVMPFVAGGSLRDRLRRETQLPVEEAVRIAAAVAGALEFAHARGVVHRDIKPENILLHHGEPLVADFGLACLPGRASSLTETGWTVGTPHYMSPEQLSGVRDVDHRCDVYALGCVLYEMLTGEPPHPGTTLEAVVARRLDDPAPSARRLRAAVPEELDRAVRRALQRTPADRFATVAEFAAAIRNACSPGSARPAAADAPPTTRHEVRFCKAPDGVRLAYAVTGQGPVLVKAANWLTHLEYDWECSIWRHWLEGLSRRWTLVRYDQRGCGLSDREVEDLAFDAFVRDLESVVDAAGLKRFALLGVSQGGAIAVAYAIRHPEKVSHLVLHGAYARGLLRRPGTPPDYARMQADMVRMGWGMDNPAFRQAFSLMFFPDATPEQLHTFSELQRQSASPEMAARILASVHSIDITDLAPRVSVPTLVMHCRDEVRIPFEEGRVFAGLIPGARLVPLPSKNHIPLEGEPAWPRFLDEMGAFLGTGAPPRGGREP